MGKPGTCDSCVPIFGLSSFAARISVSSSSNFKRKNGSRSIRNELSEMGGGVYVQVAEGARRVPRVQTECNGVNSCGVEREVGVKRGGKQRFQMSRIWKVRSEYNSGVHSPRRWMGSEGWVEDFATWTRFRSVGQRVGRSVVCLYRF